MTPAGLTWTLDAFGDGTAAVDGDAPTVQFDADGSISGSAGCNRYFGTYQHDGAELSISPLGTTKRLCAPPANAQERRFLDALQSVTMWEQTADVLTLSDASGAVTLRFVSSGETTTKRTSPDEARATLSGTVTYRQRIALPPDAVVEVQLQDVSLADAPAKAIATHTIRLDGQQVPIPYALSYAPSVIDERNRYTVRATIRDARGALLWTSDTAYPVLTRGAPMDSVEIQVVQVAESGSAAPEAERDLVGASTVFSRPTARS